MENRCGLKHKPQLKKYRHAPLPPTGYYLHHRCVCFEWPQGCIELLVNDTIPTRPVGINQCYTQLGDGKGDIWVSFITVLYRANCKRQ